MTLQVAYRPTGSIRVSARNARTHSPEQVAEIAASIKRFGFANPILVDREGEIVAGHGRLAAAQQLGLAEVPVIELGDLSPEQARALRLADNRIAQNAGWDEELLRSELLDLQAEDWDLGDLGFDDEELGALLDKSLSDLATRVDDMADWGRPPEPEQDNVPARSLADRFGVPPFSVLDARQGYWQDRKRAWLSLGIQSEIGRGGVDACPVTGSAACVTEGLSEQSNKRGFARCFGQDLMRGEHVVGSKSARLTWVAGDRPEAALDETSRKILAAGSKMHHTAASNRAMELAGGYSAAHSSGTSIFDPVLCELAYRWFCPPGGVVLDPFAGGSVRGVVASRCGREYVGVELRSEQVEANRVQAETICAEAQPVWAVGDSRNVRRLVGEDFAADFVFSCPPYADLEVYSDDPADLSTMDYPDFVQAYREIVAESCALLKPDRFACFVVGDVRDKRGNYRNFVGDTVQAFLDAGLSLYNEAILVTAVGSLSLRAGKQFAAGRKLGKTHQNVLIFVTGDGRAAADAVGSVDFGQDPVQGGLD